MTTNTSISRKEAYTAIAVITLGCLALFCFFRKPWLLGAAALVAIPSAASFRAAQAIAGAWKRAGLFLGRINTAVVLTVFFYCILTPWAALYRRFNRALVARFTDRRKDTYFRERNVRYDREVFTRQW